MVWTHPLTISIVVALAAIVGSLLTIFLSPRLQHHFWKHQRRDELRLAAIGEFNLKGKPRPPTSLVLGARKLRASRVTSSSLDRAHVYSLGGKPDLQLARALSVVAAA